MSLEEQKEAYKQYLLMKYADEDWHAIWDVAVELYRIEALIKNDKTLL